MEYTSVITIFTTIKVFIFILYRHDIKPCAYYIHQLEAFENVFFMIYL